MATNLQELLDTLNDMVIELNADGVRPEDVEVRLATQPNYPLQSSVATVTALPAKDKDNDMVVYLAEGSQIYNAPYGRSAMWNGGYNPNDEEVEDL